MRRQSDPSRRLRLCDTVEGDAGNGATRTPRVRTKSSVALAQSRSPVCVIDALPLRPGLPPDPWSDKTSAPGAFPPPSLTRRSHRDHRRFTRRGYIRQRSIVGFSLPPSHVRSGTQPWGPFVGPALFTSSAGCGRVASPPDGRGSRRHRGCDGGWRYPGPPAPPTGGHGAHRVRR